MIVAMLRETIKEALCVTDLSYSSGTQCTLLKIDALLHSLKHSSAMTTAEGGCLHTSPYTYPK
jgi:hypothetical protein